MKKLTSTADFNKFLLKRFTKLLSILDISQDFLEVSTQYKGTPYQIRIYGKPGAEGNVIWDVVRIINKSVIVPAEPLAIPLGK